MFKLAQGEYIAPEKVEGIYLLCSLVRVVLIDGCSKYPFSVVVVLPDFTELRRSLVESKTKQPTTGSLPNLSTSLGSLSDDELCRNMYVRQFVLEQMNKTGRQNNLKGFELVSNFHKIKNILY